MKKNILFGLCILCMSCKVTLVKVVHYEIYNKSQLKVKSCMFIPKGYKLKRTFSENMELFLYTYRYRDSSCMYIGRYVVGPNEENIRNYNLSDKKAIFIMGFDTSSSIILAGIDMHGLYWKEVIMNDKICIGYSHVDEYKLQDYESALKTYVVKLNSCVE